jgi:hypothetical protein
VQMCWAVQGEEAPGRGFSRSLLWPFPVFGRFACLSVWFGRMIPGLYGLIQYTLSLIITMFSKRSVPTSSVHPEAESIHPALSASSFSSSSSSELHSQPFSCTGSLSRPLRYISAARTLSSAQRQGSTSQTRLVFRRPVNSNSSSLEARTNLYVRVRNSRSYTACMSRNTVKVDFLVL